MENSRKRARECEETVLLTDDAGGLVSPNSEIFDAVISPLKKLISECARLSTPSGKGGKGAMSKQDALVLIELANSAICAHTEHHIRLQVLESRTSMIDEFKSFMTELNKQSKQDVTEMHIDLTTEKEETQIKKPEINKNKKQKVKAPKVAKAKMQPKVKSGGNNASAGTQPAAAAKTFSEVVTNENVEWQKVEKRRKSKPSKQVKPKSKRHGKNAVNSALVIHSDNLSSDDIKSQLRCHVKPGESGLRIKGLKTTAKGGVLLIADSSSDLKVITDNEALRAAGLRIEPPKAPSPRIIIRRIPCQMDADEIVSNIFKLNLGDMSNDQGHLRPSFKKGKYTNGTVDWVFEAHPTVKDRLIKLGRVYLGWEKCLVQCYATPLRCFKCQQYGHMARKCKAETDTCGHCAETGHRYAECPKKESEPKCVVCKSMGKPYLHKAADNGCKSHQKEIKRLKVRNNNHD